MFGRFDRPVGAAADVSELEYVSSLHQTADTVREDGTVSSADIRLYLRSRYGIDVPSSEALDIVRGLGGTYVHEEGASTSQKGFEAEADEEEARPSSQRLLQSGPGNKGKGEEDREEYLDLVQLTSILIIPTLLRAASATNGPSSGGGGGGGGGGGESGDSDVIGETTHDQYVRFDDNAMHIGKREGTYSWIIRDFLALLKDVRNEGQEPNTLPVNEDAVVVDETLIRLLLESFNEHAAADDDTLVRDMVDAVGGLGAILDERSLAAALASDVKAWKVGIEDTLNETFYDVYGFTPIDAGKGSRGALLGDCSPGHDAPALEMTTMTKLNTSGADTSRTESVASGEPIKIPTYIKTAPYIDYVVDNSRSLLFSMFLWVFYIFSVGVLMKAITTTEPYVIGCDSGFSCALINQVWHWVVFGAILCGAGLVVIVPISLGNDPYERDWRATALSAALLLAYSITPFAVTRQYKKGIPHSEDGVTDLEKAVSELWVDIASIVYLLCGCLMAIQLLLSRLLKIIGNGDVSEYHPILQYMLLPSNIWRGASMKRAATWKVNNLLGNARELHTADTSRGRSGDWSATENFVLHGERSEECGGLLWTWKHILSRDITEKYGIWVPLRFFAGQEGQIITLMLLIAMIVVGMKQLAEQTQSKREELASGQWSEGVETALYFVPEPWMIYASFYTGGTIAVVAAFAILLLYIPSTISTVLKLRSGVIQSLHDPLYSTFRSKADSTNNNMGNMIYGLAGSASFFFVFFGGLVFLSIWPPTRSGMALFWAWMLGLMITIALKMALTSPCREAYYAAFYRARPRAANFSSLALECWNIGLGSSVLIGRLTQFLLASAFWVGRVDVTFLDENVSMFGYQFDYTPASFRAEILVHEAHRHPFIDRLGAMYMMRMKHSTGFSSNAGACWRRLFVQAFMPWLTKFRLFGSDTNEEDDELVASLEQISSSIVNKLGKRAASRILDKVASEVCHSKEGVPTIGKSHVQEGVKSEEQKEGAFV